MVEVFKTNVKTRSDANMLLKVIHRSFRNYSANFDLTDCDHIMRVECYEGTVHASPLIDLLDKLGFSAAILADDIPLN